ncbi:RagB/SusD family nutrient uptake outer membrane protein [Flavicella sp.]|uniref:RagB/SusD family nutrient uptake outer membrane protein n=1 Tax=Flavicella sp. TaxID=2957742 RepID=UPI00301A9E71
MKKLIKNINKSILAIFGILLFVLVGCNNEDEFLNRIPLDKPNPENFFVDATSARAAVNAAFRPLTVSAHMFRRDLVLCLDAMTDDSYWRPARAHSIALGNWDVTPTNENINNYWQECYRSINAANFAIERIPTSSDPQFTTEKQLPYIAEARFIRAWSYIFLTSLYGDVPLHLIASIESKPRSSRADILVQVVADLEFAGQNLLASPIEDGVPTAAAAYGYLAKVYLWLGENEKAITAARSGVVSAEGAGFGLVDDYLSIWEEEQNKELLFYLPFATNDDTYGQNMTVQRLIRDIPTKLRTIEPGDGWGYGLPQLDLYNAFEPTDPRREFTMYAHGDNYGVYNGSEDFVYTYNTFDALGNEISETVTYQPGDLVTYNHNWSPTGFNIRKMTRSMFHLANVRWSGQDIPLMRMSELYLILAEALAEQGDAEALIYVNKVRSRASVNMPEKTVADGNLVDLVRHERRVELAMEGIRIFDLIRWGTLADVFGNGTKVKRHYHSDLLPTSNITKFDSPVHDLTHLEGLLPIPQVEMDQNNEITTQNAGY